MLAVVTGATGLLGGNLAIELLHQGYQVRALRRAGSQVDHLAAFDIDWVGGHLGDPASLEAAFRGADLVFHCAAQVGIQRRATPTLIATNVVGTKNVLAAVQDSGVRRLVHCSTVSAVGLSEDGRPCTERARWNFDEHGLDDGYATTKHHSELLVHAEARAGLDAVIVNPTFMFGPYDAKQSSGRLILEVARGRALATTPGRNNFVDVRDVARGMVLASQRGTPGERYILGGENTSYGDIMTRIAREAGVPPPALRAPRWATTVLGWLGDGQEWATGKEPLLNSVAARWAWCATFQFSSDKARRELGYAPGPVDPAIRDALAWFRQQGMCSTT
jgi:dihydroflavonol-4-reductase